jgi:hypothetical protein
VTDDGVRICAPGTRTAGDRAFYDACPDFTVTDDAGRRFCSELCFGNDLGDCPYDFTCARATCNCLAFDGGECMLINCEQNEFAGDRLCFPNDGYARECDDDDDCLAGDYCAPDGTCRVDDREGCLVCESCSTDAECGPGGVCIQGEYDWTPWCTHGCESDVDCPGDSVCGAIAIDRDGNTFRTCRGPADVPDYPGCAGDYVCNVGCRDDVPCTVGDCVDGECVVAEPEPEPTDEVPPDDDDDGMCTCASAERTSPGFALMLVAGAALAGRRRARSRGRELRA